MPNLAIGYTREGAKMGEFKNNAYTGVLMKGSPAGGGYSTVEDLLKFGQALQSHKLLSPESREMLLEGQQFPFWDCMSPICKSAGAGNGTTDRRFGISPPR